METTTESQDKSAHMRFYKAKRDIFSKLGPMIDIMVNLNDECDNLASKYTINSVFLKDWVKENMFYILDEETDES